jgi:endonuclease YncB( thermonuclease family)
VIGLRTPRRLVRRAGRLRIGELLAVAAIFAGGFGLNAILERADIDTVCAPGVVTNVVDGDTLDVGPCRVRLLAVDTPETQWRQRGTPWCADYALGHEAKRVVVSLTLGQPVTFGATEDDSSGRDMAAEVYLQDGTELGGWLVSAGLAVPWPAESPATACPLGGPDGMEPNK